MSIGGDLIDIIPLIVYGDRLDPHGVVCFKVLLREEAAGLFGERDDPFHYIPMIEALAIRTRQFRQSLCHIGASEQFSRFRWRSIHRERIEPPLISFDPISGSGLADLVVLIPPKRLIVHRDGIPLPRCADRGLPQFLQRHGAKALVNSRPAGRCPRHDDRCPASQRDLLEPALSDRLRCQSLGTDPAGVQPIQLSFFGPDERKTVSADAIAHRFYQRERPRYSDGGVDRVPSSPHDLYAYGGCQRLRCTHHPVFRIDDVPDRRIPMALRIECQHGGPLLSKIHLSILALEEHRSHERRDEHREDRYRGEPAHDIGRPDLLHQIIALFLCLSPPHSRSRRPRAWS